MRTKTIEDEDFWIKHVEAYRSGNCSNKHAYCLQAKINYHRFLYWYQKIIKELVAQGELSRYESFMPVQIAKTQQINKSDSLLCTLEFKQGHKLKIYDESILKKLVELLSE